MTDRIKAVCELTDFILEGMKWPCQEVFTEIFLCGVKVRCRLDGRLPVTVAWPVMALVPIIRRPDVAGYWMQCNCLQS
jgi:hypothetical protein